MRLSAAKQKHGAELDALRHLGQMPAAHQRRAQPGQVAFVRCGKQAVESLRARPGPAPRCPETQAARYPACTLRIAHVGQRTVCQRQGEQVWVLELVAEETCGRAVVRFGQLRRVAEGSSFQTTTSFSNNRRDSHR